MNIDTLYLKNKKTKKKKKKKPHKNEKQKKKGKCMGEKKKKKKRDSCLSYHLFVIFFCILLLYDTEKHFAPFIYVVICYLRHRLHFHFVNFAKPPESRHHKLMCGVVVMIAV